jgi:hypothetical protein
MGKTALVGNITLRNKYSHGACQFTNCLHNCGNYFDPQSIYPDERALIERV